MMDADLPELAPLDPAAVAAHPVFEVLRTRRESSGAAGHLDDPHRVALVVEGGGMRGVISSAMTASLEAAGLTDCLDLVVGASAGALNGAAMLAGVADGCCRAYYSAFTSRRFINPYRLLLGRAAIDVAYSLDHADESLDAGRHERTVESAIPLHCVAVDVETAQACDLCDLATTEDLRQALLASSRMPWVGGKPVSFRGRRYLDGGLADAIPYQLALELGATHALVLQTRPWGVKRTPPPGFADRLIRRQLRRLNPRLIDLYDRRTVDYERTVGEIAQMTEYPQGGPPFVYGLRLPAGAPVVGQLERRAEPLETAARAARDHADRVLSAAGFGNGDTRPPR